jgi:predicted amidohydrolase
MTDDLKVIVLQADLHWRSVDANLASFEEQLWEIGKGTDLFVLPEMFNTAFVIDAKLAETMNGRTHKWMKQMAAQMQGAVCGSLMVVDGDKIFNRFILVDKGGNTQFYDKRHLWLGPEADILSSGTERVIWTLNGWRIFPIVCYDLRFPVWSRQASEELEYDALINVASWPSRRVIAWQRMLPSRAVENLAYCIGVNRTGIDGDGVRYPGCSGIWRYDGEKMAEMGSSVGYVSATFSSASLAKYREKLPFNRNADRFKIL